MDKHVIGEPAYEHPKTGSNILHHLLRIKAKKFQPFIYLGQLISYVRYNRHLSKLAYLF